MTVHAYRDGVLACDSLCWDGDMQAGLQLKSHRSGLLLWGVTGEVSYGHVLKDWMWGGARGDLPIPRVEANGFIVMPNDTVLNLSKTGAELLLGLPFYAAGAGRAIALGAMEAGASAPQAVAAAIRWMPGACGGPIRVLTRPGARVG